MSGKTSGASARAHSKKTTAKGAKSVKADGTPKQRWSAAERRESNRPPRRSSGRQYEDPRSDTPRSQGRSYNSSSSDNRSSEGRGYERRDGQRSDARSSGPRQYDRSDRPRDERGDDRPRYERTDRSSNGYRSDRPSSDRPSNGYRGDRPSSDRPSNGYRSDRGRDDRSRDDRPRSYDRSTTDRPRRDDRPSYDRSRSDRPSYDRTGSDRPSYDRSRPQNRRFDDRPRYDRSDRSDRGRNESSAPESDQMSWEAPSQDPSSTVSETTTALPTSGGFAELGVPKALVSALHAGGITQPFPIQTATIPDALAGRDVLGRGQTGSGKTLGFGLPMITTLSGSNAPSGCARALVLVPTRELALQVADVLAPLARIQGLSLTLVAGGMPYGPQLKAFERGVDIVVATPGRLIDLMDQGAADLTRVEAVVLDEADHMADLGFMPAVTQILDTVPAGGQRLLFSATLDGAVNRLVKRYLSDPVTHEVDSAQASVGSMEHHVLLVRPSDKATVTAEIAGRDGRTVIFVRTQLGANRVAEQLREAGVLAGALHGGLTQGARARMLGAFKDGRLPVLVATDVAARGIHVDEIGLVLQVDPPAGPKDYLHRAGRTARAGETGVVVTLALPHQRREVERLTRQAGVQTVPLNAEPGDTLVVAATGSRVPSGPAVSQQEFDKLVAPPARAAKRHPGQGNRSRGSFRGGSAGRRPRY
ncbi:MAG TPA: DEAD/DEAH box helicase [Microlunatus sp.]|nr:DEAD/DEAH box helicase [Microlunatus sp.]